MDPDRLAYWLLKDVNRAIRDFTMIADGGRVAVAVSGGKDSLSLLRLLDYRRRSAAERYTLAAVHVVGDARGPAIEAHRPLLEWLEASGVKHLVVPLYLPAEEPLPLGCQRCTWNRRRTLFEAAQRLGCNVVAFGHHADDPDHPAQPGEQRPGGDHGPAAGLLRRRAAADPPPVLRGRGRPAPLRLRLRLSATPAGVSPGGPESPPTGRRAVAPGRGHQPQRPRQPPARRSMRSDRQRAGDGHRCGGANKRDNRLGRSATGPAFTPAHPVAGPGPALRPRRWAAPRSAPRG